MRSSAARSLLLGLVVGFGALGCSGTSDPSTRDEAFTTATITFTPDYRMQVSGQPAAGKPLRIVYAPERLPQCRGNLGGGAPGWTITGFYSENGGPPKTFEPTALSSAGTERVAKPTDIIPLSGGDLALWFQVTSRWGCSEYDSAFGQNFHVDVAGAPPEATASITFTKDGPVTRDGVLRAGGKVRIRYEQDRLPDCRRIQLGSPVWTITGFASVAGAEAQTFQTGRPNGSDREPIDATLDLPRAGALALWFQVTSLGGCMKYDSMNGANYTFPIE